MSGDDSQKHSLAGTVVKAELGGSSKSAHQGFVLQTNKGQVKLRREGGSPFYDAFFKEYENKNVTVEGYEMEQYFLVTDIQPAP
jgi:hypothetical protein